jgi:hypothetical protein
VVVGERGLSVASRRRCRYLYWGAHVVKVGLVREREGRDEADPRKPLASSSILVTAFIHCALLFPGDLLDYTPLHGVHARGSRAYVKSCFSGT